MIAGEGYENFRLLAQFSKVPLLCTCSMEQLEFLKTYIGSVEFLDMDKIRKTWLEIDREKLCLGENEIITITENQLKIFPVFICCPFKLFIFTE